MSTPSTWTPEELEILEELAAQEAAYEAAQAEAVREAEDYRSIGGGSNPYCDDEPNRDGGYDE